MPEQPCAAETQYVLDGMQRLLTLYASFNGGGTDGCFDLYFDLEQRRFYHVPRRGGARLKETDLLLKRVFSPRQFIEDQLPWQTCRTRMNYCNELFHYMLGFRNTHYQSLR